MNPAKSSGGWFGFPAAAVLRVTGDDALTFLQGQLTQELRPDRSAAVGYGLLLSQKGKVVADVTVLRVAPTDLWLVSDRVPAAVIRERLEAYVIADDVNVSDETAAHDRVVLVGEAGSAWLAQAAGGGLPATGAWTASAAGGWIYRRPGAGEGWDWLFPRGAGVQPALPLWERDDWERARLAAGVPAIPDDLGPGDLPNEGGLEDSAISYTKGCYLGQEVMARLKSMGQVRRRLHRVRGSGAVPAERPADLFQSGKRVGELRSAVAAGADGWIGLAMLSQLSLDRTAPLSWSPEPTSNPTVTVVDSP